MAKTIKLPLIVTVLILLMSAIAAIYPRPVKADPACVNGGVYVLFVRGSGESFSDKQAHQFYWTLLGSSQNPGALLQRGLSVGWAELGNLDNDNDDQDSLDFGEYPAVGPGDWILGNPNYGRSVEIGTNELVAHLNDRAQRCPREAIVLGGYSQGADVIGWALERQGYGSLTQRAKDHLAFTALYGDPRNNTGCPYNEWWERGDSPNYNNCRQSILGPPRNPYFPAEMWGRSASWCDRNDGFCNGGLYPGSHGSVYQDHWISESAPEIAAAAVSKVLQLNSPDLFLIKTRNTASGKVEIHSVSAVDSYRSGSIHAATYLSSANQNDGWFQMVNVDLYFIKTKNTSSGQVEIHTATNASGYQKGEHWVTRFSLADQDNGWFQMVGDTLFFIKTRNTSLGKIEIHALTRASSYNSGQSNSTWIYEANHDNGWFQIVGSNLYFIKTRNVDSGRVEVHVATSASNYMGGVSYPIGMSPADQNNGWYQMEGQNLYFIKTRNTGSGLVEVHSKVGASSYNTSMGSITYVKPADQDNGWFQVGNK